jgi:hypothetical protein
MNIEDRMVSDKEKAMLEEVKVPGQDVKVLRL